MSAPQRLPGGGGLKSVSGPLAGSVGSICSNGVFNVPGEPVINPGAMLTGGSNCTITLPHAFLPPVP